MELFTPGHLIVIAVVALVLFFGWKQLPDMARSVGRSLRVFKTEIKGMGADDEARTQHDAAASQIRTEPAAIEAPRPAPRPRPTPHASDADPAARDRAAGSR